MTPPPWTCAALVALDAASLPFPYTVVNLSILQLKAKLPPPAQVPVLCWGDTVVTDSTAIMRFLDTQAPAVGGTGAPLFPVSPPAVAADVSAVEDEADALLSPYLRYYALYDDDGFARCLKKQVHAAVPWGLGWLAELAMWPQRAQRREVLQAAAPELDTRDPKVRVMWARAGTTMAPPPHTDFLGVRHRRCAQGCARCCSATRRGCRRWRAAPGARTCAERRRRVPLILLSMRSCSALCRARVTLRSRLAFRTRLTGCLAWRPGYGAWRRSFLCASADMSGRRMPSRRRRCWAHETPCASSQR